MRIPIKDFYTELATITNTNIDIVNSKYVNLSREELLKKPSPEKWSIGECLQHLVKYGDFYLTAMEESIVKYSGNHTPNTYFKTGYFGNKFANMLRYKKTGMKTMKSPKIESLSFVEVDNNIINIFLEQQQQHLSILNKTKSLKMEKVKVPIALTNTIKTKIGDTLRFSIYHNQRHIIQAEKVFNQLF